VVKECQQRWALTIKIFNDSQHQRSTANTPDNCRTSTIGNQKQRTTVNIANQQSNSNATSRQRLCLQSTKRQAITDNVDRQIIFLLSRILSLILRFLRVRLCCWKGGDGGGGGGGSVISYQNAVRRLH
jgi:hypothetical protein